MPATPKAPGARRRRNLEQKQWVTLPTVGRRDSAPALPPKKPAWLKRTRAWWEVVWASPMAAAWEPADIDGLVRLAELKDLFARNSTAAMLPAMQQLEDRYGLNPKSRQQMLWQIERGENAKPARAQAETAPRLRAV